MFAPGAMACAYSTSSDVSCAQLTITGRFEGSKAGIGPSGCSTENLGGAGRLKALSNFSSSDAMPW